MTMFESLDILASLAVVLAGGNCAALLRFWVRVRSVAQGTFRRCSRFRRHRAGFWYTVLRRIAGVRLHMHAVRVRWRRHRRAQRQLRDRWAGQDLWLESHRNDWDTGGRVLEAGCWA